MAANSQDKKYLCWLLRRDPHNWVRQRIGNVIGESETNVRRWEKEMLQLPKDKIWRIGTKNKRGNKLKQGRMTKRYYDDANGKTAEEYMEEDIYHKRLK